MIATVGGRACNLERGQAQKLLKKLTRPSESSLRTAVASFALRLISGNAVPRFPGRCR